ncbi:MAG: nucleoside hydrolase [Planctomycetaceae bacterium TMED10]|nr:MAG: nucleoside hydrolase [Planctomycetaceae bacterium TMED10]|tara:strand:+ start:262 stop:1191 length:930 start_codon:yes stop_codon:yes gene_type:complete
MAKKVILDVDPHVDAAVALALALFDPELEVVAVTATAGCVAASQATKNIQAIIEQLDPPRLPRIGVATETDTGYLGDLHHLYGKDGLGGTEFAVSELHHRHPADKVICEEIRKAPDEVAIVALGPLTNLSLALTREPDLESLIGEIYIRGGSLGSGDVTSAAEFNMYCNPTAAQRIFHSATTKSLIPLDVTQQVVMTYDQLDEISDTTTKSGKLLRKFLPFIFRAYRTVWGLEGIHLPSAVALAVISHPELFARKSLYGDVESSGDLTLGATIFDRRIRPDNQANMEVITDIDVVATMDYILRGLAKAS